MSKNRIFKTKKYTSKKAILAVAAFVVLAVLVPAGILFANHYINKDVPAMATINDEKEVLAPSPSPAPTIVPTPTPTPTPTPPPTPSIEYVKENNASPATSKGNENELPVMRVKNGEKIAYLTFDDGPSESVTPHILDILKRYNIKGTFFVLGKQAQRYPDIIRRIYNEGHTIANHGYSHVYKQIYSSNEAFISEITKTESIVDEILGFDYDMGIFRFPGGSSDSYKQKFKPLLAQLNYKYIDWNCLTNDAVGKKKADWELFEEYKKTAGEKEKIVFLMHDSAGKEEGIKALPYIIEDLIIRGYSFEPLIHYKNEVVMVDEKAVVNEETAGGALDEKDKSLDIQGEKPDTE